MATPEQFMSNSTTQLSAKQSEVLHVIARSNTDGSSVDRHQLRQRLSYNPKLDAVNFILRYMLAQKRIEIVEKKAERISENTGFKIFTPTYRVTELGRSFIATE